MRLADRLAACNGSTEALLREVALDPNPEQWERISVSPYSPGPVRNDEVLVRFALSPTHVDEMLQRLDREKLLFDATKIGRGCSLRRVSDGAADIELIQAGTEFVEKQNRIRELSEKPSRIRILHAVLRVRCCEIRSLVNRQQLRSAVICDTALREDSMHADLIAIRCNDKLDKQKFRIDCFEVFCRSAIFPSDQYQPDQPSLSS